MSIVDQLHWIVTSYAGASFFPFSVTTFSWMLPCDVATDFYLYSLQFWMNTVLRISLDSQCVTWFIPYSYKCPFVLEALFVLIFRKTNFGTNGREYNSLSCIKVYLRAEYETNGCLIVTTECMTNSFRILGKDKFWRERRWIGKKLRHNSDLLGRHFQKLNVAVDRATYSTLKLNPCKRSLLYVLRKCFRLRK